MDYAGDIAKLRQEGASDDDILDTYRTIAPHEASDIDKLKGEGVTSKDILDFIGTRKPAPAPKAAPENTDGFLETQKKRLQYGAAQGLTAIGSTARHLGMGENSIEQIGKGLAPDKYDPAMPKFMNEGGDGFGWRHAPGAIMEALPAALTTLGATVINPALGIGTGAAQVFGPALDKRKENNGGKDLTATDYAAAGGDALISGLLDRVGVGGITGAAMKGAGLKGLASIPGAIAKAGVKEGVTEGAQSVVDQVAVTAGTDKGLDLDLKQALGEGILGGGVGAGLRSAGAVGDVRNAVRWAGGDQDSKVRVADRFASLDNDIANSQDQARAIDTVQDIIKGDIKRSMKTAKGVLEQTGGQEAVDSARAVLKNGEVLTEDQKATLNDALARHPDGLELLQNINDYNTLNEVRQSGHRSGENFDGGIVGKFGDYLDPRRLGKTLMGKAAGGLTVGSALEIPFISQLGISAPFVAKFLAAQSAAYAGAKGIDRLMGNANPVRSFRDQFSGMETKAPEINNPVTSTDELKAMAQRASQRNRLDGILEGAVQKGVKEAVSDQKRIRTLGNDIAKIEDDAREAHSKEQAKVDKKRDSEVEASWRAKSLLEKAPKLPGAMDDKAWAPVEPKLPKAASEEKLWAYQEKKQAAEARLEKAKTDNNQRAIAEADKALADIEQEYRTLELDIRALELKAEAEAQKEATKEASRKATETDRAWKAYEEMQKAQKPSPALSDSLWAPQEARPKADPKARQMGEMTRLLEDPVNDPQWSDTLAENAIKKAESPMEAALKERRDAKPPKAPKKSREEIRSEAEAMFEKPEAESRPEASPDMERVTVGDITIEKPKSEITYPGPWKRKLTQRLTIRKNFIDDGIKAVPEAREVFKSLEYDLSHNISNWPDAAERIESALMSVSSDIKTVSKLVSVLENHKAKLEGTYGRKASD
jgi:hypothetical protein